MTTRPIEGQRGGRLTYYGVIVDAADYSKVKRLADLLIGELPDLTQHMPPARASRAMYDHATIAVQFAVWTLHEWRRRRPR